MTNQPLSWSFSQIWNKSLEDREVRPIVARQHMWASELGKSPVDRWYKMKGHTPSNPPNSRSLRKFEAGNVFEWLVEMVLKRAGILIGTQEWVEYQYPGLPRVTGKLDQYAGGKPDVEGVEKAFKDGELPDFMKKAAMNIVKTLAEKYPNGLENIILETKSTSSFMFPKYESGIPEPHHALQNFHYLKAKDIREGHIVYISKDDLMMVEIGVINGPVMEEKYRRDIEMMAEVLKSDEPPPKEPEIVFKPDTKKFAVNWQVAYSAYLTDVYGYEDQKAFDDAHKGKAARWNRVITRILEEKNMTDNNKEAIAEMEAEFPDFRQLI